MRPESTCAHLREEISARLDGEVDVVTARLLDEHIATCTGCRRYERAVSEARRSLRARPAESVPDLTERIMQRVSAEVPRVRRRREWQSRARVAAIGAAASALLLFGASLPFGERRADVASATEIIQEVRAAARTLTSYQASYRIVERNWHPDVPVRRFEVEVAFESPERFSLSIADETAYPTRRWPRNDVRMISSGGRWWLREPSTCPVEALPGCVAGGPERRSVVARQPFDGSSRLPTDIIVPLQTIGGSVGLDVVGGETFAGRPAYRVALPYPQAAPLIESFQAGGSWRSFHPLDRVEIDLDADTWFPLGFEVRASESPERKAWAARRGYTDRPGAPVLRGAAVDFSEESSTSFRVPVSGIVKNGGFRESETRDGGAPRFTAGLRPHRSGRVDGTRVRTYVRGLTWLKIASERSRSRPAVRFFSSEEVRLPGGGTGYYAPSSLHSARRIDLFGSGRHVALETNLPRADLLRVAGSIPVSKRPLPRTARLSGGFVVDRLASQEMEVPAGVPAGYRVAAAVRSQSPDGRATVTTYLRRAENEYDGFGIRLVETEPARRLAPPGEEFVEIPVGEVTGRWSPERGELEWIEDSTYRAVAAPSLDLGTVLRVALELT